MQHLVLLTATDLELIAGQVVKGVLLLLFFFAIVFNFIQLFKSKDRNKKVIRGMLALAFFFLIIPVARWMLIEDSLLRNAEFTVGITVDTCQVFARGKGISFEYEVNGKTYRNCSTYHPIPLHNIVVPGGRYAVRYSRRFPEKGRIDFENKKN